jgi:hypothetical protein
MEKYDGHVGDSVEGGGIVLAKDLFFTVEGASIPLQRLFVPSTLVEHQGQGVDCIKSRRVFVT